MAVLKNLAHELVAVRMSYGEALEEAGEAAGLTKAQAVKLGKNIPFQTRVEQLLLEQDRRKAANPDPLDQAWVMNRLRENVDRAMQIIPVRDDEGNVIGEFRYQGNIANESLRLIGTHLGMFVERHEHGRAGEFAGKTNAELLEFIGKHAPPLLLLDKVGKK